MNEKQIWLLVISRKGWSGKNSSRSYVRNSVKRKLNILADCGILLLYSTVVVFLTILKRAIAKSLAQEKPG